MGNVYVAGVGMTPFGKLLNWSIKEMARAAKQRSEEIESAVDVHCLAGRECPVVGREQADHRCDLLRLDARGPTHCWFDTFGRSKLDSTHWSKRHY
jgi:hypothetical protein